jgi:23S rRNA (adenine2503-C2)-methyltransferase
MRTDQTEERPQTADIGSMTKEELAAWLAERGEKKFRAAQVFSWIHRKQAASYEEMTNIPKALRETLAKEAALSFPEEVLVVESGKHDTKKFLFRLFDGNVIESVWMKHRHGNSVCISSQVGCDGLPLLRLDAGRAASGT